MRVELNAEPREVAETATVADVVELLPGVDRGRRGVAVALNGEVVSRSQWDDVRLNEGDRVEVLRAVGGGA